ncbi:MAG: flagellar FliJ family protein [Pseudomonadota bacterium]|jgi:flagellar FliJ protein|nr:flagellar FliJ family protein [Pseudomonadota bacterium]MEC9044991.1 flagellar FliJ family protein [Pseudomonadota bacterium]MEC9099733.1 flagellar FliJ family protein [Pseudomonadota bacterium]MED5225670.1 flagellar FliJ family protein [Pseudomonadota bacterium]MED5473392.1 flagellar FliJ family protein [Pseudomonadota bacterium]|tara:strand:+ start:2369 stop:2785 length:417 start_codon:yes stop_codon:yes gene_type:complete
MSQYDKLVRLKEFELDERRRDAGSILAEVNRLTEKKQSLELSLKQEQDVSSSSVEVLGQYSKFALRVLKEREMLDEAIVEVEKAYSEANRLVTAAYQEVRKAEIIRDEAAKKEAEKIRRDEQIESDEVAQNIHRQKNN